MSFVEKGQKLYSEGWRLQGWGLSLTDTYNEVVLLKDGKKLGYWADGTNRHTEEAFALLGLNAQSDEDDEVLHHLSNLTDGEE